MRGRRRITATKSEWKSQKLASPFSFIRRRHKLNAISTGTVTPTLLHVCFNYTAALYAWRGWVRLTLYMGQHMHGLRTTVRVCTGNANSFQPPKYVEEDRWHQNLPLWRCIPNRHDGTSL